MKKLSFPSFRYHPKLGAKIIHSETEHESHKKDGWHQSPADFAIEPAKEEKPMEKPESEEKEPKKKSKAKE